MRVILLDNIRGVGQIGDVKDVSDGYARNYLLPRKLAKLATSISIKEAENLKSKRELIVGQEHERAQEVADKLKDVVIEISGKANKKGTLFAAISADDIADAISKKAGVRIQPEAIELDEHLKTLGDHTARVNLSDGISANLKVIVVPVQK